MPCSEALAGGTRFGNDAALGFADEAEDGVPVDGSGEVGLDIRDGLAHVHSFEIEGVVDFLDFVYLLFGEAAAKKAHAVDALKHNGFTTGENIGGNVLGNFGEGCHESVRANF